MTDQSSYCENPSVLEYVLPKKIMIKEGKKESHYELKSFSIEGSKKNLYEFGYVNKKWEVAYKIGFGLFWSSGEDRQTALYKMKEFMYNYEKEMKKKRNK